jgi:hypothetical protein
VRHFAESYSVFTPVRDAFSVSAPSTFIYDCEPVGTSVGARAMKAIVLNSFLVLSFVACGSNVPSDVADEDVTASSADSLRFSNIKLNPARTQALVNAFSALDPSVFPDHLVPSFDANAEFAKIDVSSPIKSASFGHSTFILVPAGTSDKGENPNLSQVFYVAYGASTNTKAKNFGPFVLRSQVGDQCGGFVASALRCAEGLECISNGNPDAPGVCQEPEAKSGRALGESCGGFAGIRCASGLVCETPRDVADAMGTCKRD